MKYLIIPIRSQTATFRDPEFQNYHRTLPLPPPATCIGLAGAALGLAPEAAQDFFAGGEWEMAIGGTSAGLARDLWKYNDFKNGSILIRELLYDNHFTLVFGHTDRARIDDLEGAFRRPVFALSCGSSDSLCTIDLKRMYQAVEVAEEKELADCYTSGDIIADSLSKAKADRTASFSIHTTSLPLAQDLPVRFAYDNKGGRMLKERRLLSYVKYPTRLPQSVTGIRLTPNDKSRSSSPRFLPLFPL